MDTKLVEKINAITKDKPVFYVCNDAERALGLENILDNYHIICIDHNDIVDYLEDKGAKVFCLEKVLGEKNTLFRNSYKLLKHPKTREYIAKYAKEAGFVMTFKISPAFEKLVESMGFDLLNTKAVLNRTYEQKISQFEKLSETVNFPRTIIGTIGKLDYKELIKKVSEYIVVQFDTGHTGSGTIFINSEEQFNELKEKFPKRTARISEKISGDAYTINALAGNGFVLMAGLSYQITGVKELTDMEGGTVGNDFSYTKNLNDAQRTKIGEQVKKISEFISKDGYKGFFGVDLIVSGDDVYIIEVNARQPASVPFVNKLQLVNGQTPMPLYHIATFMNIEFETQQESYNKENTKSFEAGQIFLRNTDENPFAVNGEVRTGTYRLQSDNSAVDWESQKVKENVVFLDEDKDKPLIFQNRAYSIEGMPEASMLILTQSKEKIVNPGNELARIQALHALIDDSGKPFKWVLESLNAIKQYLK